MAALNLQYSKLSKAEKKDSFLRQLEKQLQELWRFSSLVELQWVCHQLLAKMNQVTEIKQLFSSRIITSQQRILLRRLKRRNRKKKKRKQKRQFTIINQESMTCLWINTRFIVIFTKWKKLTLL